MTTCFSCQNLLSDFVEGILPSARHEDLKKHLDGCKECSRAHKDVVSALGLLQKLHWEEVPNEILLQATEAAEAGRTKFFTRTRLTKMGVGLAVPCVVVAMISFVFPTVIPWGKILPGRSDSSQFLRYFPLTQGAAEIVEEQSQLLHSREPFAGSMWEEGGLSPEDFEKSFQMGAGSSGGTAGGGGSDGVMEDGQ